MRCAAERRARQDWSVPATLPGPCSPAPLGGCGFQERGSKPRLWRRQVLGGAGVEDQAVQPLPEQPGGGSVLPEGTAGKCGRGATRRPRGGSAIVSSCPEREEQRGGGKRGDWEEGARASRKGVTKEPSTNCHLHVTGSAPPLLPFFPLFLQLWALESALCAQMLGSNSWLGPHHGGPRGFRARGCSNL